MQKTHVRTMSKQGILVCSRSAKHGRVSHDQCGCNTLFLIERVMLKKGNFLKHLVFICEIVPLTPVNPWCAVGKGV